MARILHFLRSIPGDEPNEYIVIVDDDQIDPEDFNTQGFYMDATYDLENTGRLPVQTILHGGRW